MSEDLQAYPECKDSGVPWLGKVPVHWDAERLKWLAANIANQGLVDNPSMPYIALEQVEGWTGRVRAAHADMVNGIVKRFLPNDILFGKLRPYLAKVTRPNVAGCCVGEFFVLRQRDPRFIPRYYEHLLRSQPIIGLVNGSTFGAKMPRADWGVVGSVLVPIPPPDEQDAIARYLDEMDRRITRFIRNRRRLIEVLNERKQAVINRAVTRGLDPNAPLKPSGIDWLGDIPEHWEVRQFRAFGGGFSNGTTAEQLLSGESAYLVSRIETISNGHIDYSKVGYLRHDYGVQGYYLKKHDFLISHINSYARVGNSARYNGEQPLLHGMNLIRVTPKPFVEPHFLEYLLKSNVFIGSMQRACKPAINQVSVTTTAIKAIRFPNPPLPEQKHIVNYLDKVTTETDAAVEKAQREIDLIREYRTRLIADVVTGKVDVRDLAPPPGGEDLEETDDELEPLDDAVGELDEEALTGEVAG